MWERAHVMSNTVKDYTAIAMGARVEIEVMEHDYPDPTKLNALDLGLNVGRAYRLVILEYLTSGYDWDGFRYSSRERCYEAWLHKPDCSVYIRSRMGDRGP